MPRNNTARQIHLVSSREAPARMKPLPADRRPSGPGLVAAVLASLVLWFGLLWLGVIAVRFFSV